MNVFKKLYRNGSNISFTIDEPSICPICKYSIKAEELYFEPYVGEEGHPYIASLYRCNHCFKVFTVLYDAMSAPAYDAIQPLYVEPNYPEHHQFQPEIDALSPKFVEIYNQAAAAESHNLDEIAGLGYRKALEFLVKDFSIHISPDKADEIKAKPLSSCINEIQTPEIQALASRSSWIGNDEAHYVRKHPDLEIKDLKRFIHALVGYISMALTVEEAEQIQKA